MIIGPRDVCKIRWGTTAVEAASDNGVSVTGTLCLANVNVLNLNCQEMWREIIKVGTEDFIQGIEFKTGCDNPKFPHEQNNDTGILGQDWGPRRKIIGKISIRL